MAEETVDEVVKVCKLNAKTGCVTPGLLLEGAHDYSPLLYIRLVQDYGLEVDVSIFCVASSTCMVFLHSEQM